MPIAAISVSRKESVPAILDQCMSAQAGDESLAIADTIFLLTKTDVRQIAGELFWFVSQIQHRAAHALLRPAEHPFTPNSSCVFEPVVFTVAFGVAEWGRYRSQTLAVGVFLFAGLYIHSRAFHPRIDVIS
jgi:hypothetical protein